MESWFESQMAGLAMQDDKALALFEEVLAKPRKGGSLGAGNLRRILLAAIKGKAV